MHNNYYFLRPLSAQLENKLKGYSIVSCFSQNKDELVIELNNTEQSFFIKAYLGAQFSCLSFPENFSRARKNSIDLFPDIILKKVTGIRQFENERCFSLQLESKDQLLFKMHGNRANVLLADHYSVKAIFRNHQKADFETDVASPDRVIDWSKEAFITHEQDPSRLYFTFGKEVWAYLKENGFDGIPTEKKWELIQQTIRQLNHPEFYLIEKENKIIFSLLPFGNIIEKSSDPIKAVNEFFHRYTSSYHFASEKSTVLKQLNDQLTASLHYIAKNQQKLNEIQNDHHYQAWGDLVMANMHTIKQGNDKVVVDDFYHDNKPIEIKLKRDLSPQKNAEVFYRKGKNQQIEIEKLKEAIAKKEKEAERLTKSILEIEASEGLKDFRKIAGDAGLPSQREKEAPLPPYHEFEFKGFKIWVGRNAEKNDELTLKYTYKEDLWLHTKDVPGSHVIIKHQAGKKFPKEVIERAAELAAYNSKRRTETLCAVIFTPKKFVRKRKGDPAGAMVVEKEEVILVEPRL